MDETKDGSALVSCDRTNKIQTMAIKPVEHNRCMDKKNGEGYLERPISHKLELGIQKLHNLYKSVPISVVTIASIDLHRFVVEQTTRTTPL